MDSYYYARNHSKGPGAWCVQGPGGFEIAIPNLDKSAAFVVGKVLSGRYREALEMLEWLARTDQSQPPSPEWWDGHRTGFVKGLEEARQQAISLAKEEGMTSDAAALRLLASQLWELQQQ